MPSDLRKSRLQHVINELDEAFGAGYVAANPNVVAAMLIATSIDTAGALVATALVDDIVTIPVPLRRGLAG